MSVLKLALYELDKPQRDFMRDLFSDIKWSGHQRDSDSNIETDEK